MNCSRFRFIKVNPVINRKVPEITNVHSEPLNNLIDAATTNTFNPKCRMKSTIIVGCVNVRVKLRIN